MVRVPVIIMSNDEVVVVVAPSWVTTPPFIIFRFVKVWVPSMVNTAPSTIISLKS